MANPSLQIGNDNWAIKEDNLLGYSTAGTRFVPQPITMTRATLGTRVNPSGLVEDVALLGSELVTNGDFSNGGTDWTIQSGTINFTGGAEFVGSGIIKQTSILSSIPTYKITYEVTSVSGNPNFQLYVNYTWYSAPSTIGVHTIYERINNTVFYLRNNSSDNITIDNVSVKEATIDNLPRVDYTDGTSSLLVEPQRTNLIPYSEDFSESAWTKTRCTIDSGGHTSPSGESNAFKMTATDDDARLQDGSEAAGVVYTQSIYVKSVTGSNVSGQIDFTGTQIKTFTATSEWQRVDTTSDDTRAGVVRVRITNSGDELYIWGAQLEQGFYPTSYIKTSGSTVTRNQETYTKTGISDKINSEEGVLFVEIAALANDGTSRRISLSDGSISNRVSLELDETANKIKVFISLSGTSQILEYTATNLLQFNKIAIKYKINDFAIWFNGTEVATDSSGDVPTGMNELSFTAGSTSHNFDGKVKQLQIFKTALSDSELATLTT